LHVGAPCARLARCRQRQQQRVDEQDGPQGNRCARASEFLPRRQIPRGRHTSDPVGVERARATDRGQSGTFPDNECRLLIVDVRAIARIPLTRRARSVLIRQHVQVAVGTFGHRHR
jgi:hypothetical protein